MINSGFTFRRVREEMIENLLNMGIKDFRVLDAISQVPRHIFIDEALWSRAYENRSLTIGYKQTISQPYIVAKMTELLISHTKARGKILNNVLELGTGCGYQTAVLSYFCENIYSIERIKPLVNKARENLSELKIRNVELIVFMKDLIFWSFTQMNVLIAPFVNQNVPLMQFFLKMSYQMIR